MNRTTNNWLLSTGVRLDTSDIQRQLDQVASQFHLDLRNASVDDFTNSMRDLTQEMRNVDQETDNVNEHTQELGLTYQEANLIMRKCVDTISEMIDRVTELDSAIVEFTKVSDLQGKELDAYVEKLGDMGIEVARSTSEMVEAATSFRKMGFDDEQAAQLGQISEMYRNIADEEMSAGEAADFIISQLKAFNLEASEAIHVVNAVNEVSNNYAVSSADLANNIGKASAALAIGGNTLEEVIGLMTAGTEITQNASKVARGNSVPKNTAMCSMISI